MILGQHQCVGAILGSLGLGDGQAPLDGGDGDRLGLVVARHGIDVIEFRIARGIGPNLLGQRRLS